MCSYGQGSVRAASGTTLGVLGTSKMKENERFYGFTDFRGKLAGRGGCSHRSMNQVTTGRGDRGGRTGRPVETAAAGRGEHALVEM